MKLLVDCHVFDGKFQGTRTYIQGLYAEMVRHRDIDFYFAAQDIERLKAVFGEAENIHYVSLHSGGSIKRLAVEFPRIIKELGIDYAHFQYISPLVKRCKEIVTTHDLLFMDMPQYFPLTYRVKNGLLFRLSAKKADVLLTVSEFSRQEMVRHFGISADKIAVTPNAVLPIEDSMPLPDVKAKWQLDKYILTVGRLEPRKNFLLLLKAFVEMRLCEQGYKLMVVGAPDMTYQAFVDYHAALSENVKKAVVMTTASFPELVALYKNATLFVFPSLGEGFGIPPLEAIEYGCPVLCSDATAMGEFRLPEECMFSPQDIEELKRKMNHALYGQTASVDAKTINEHFNWKRSADVLYEAIRKDMETTKTQTVNMCYRGGDKLHKDGCIMPQNKP